ncbi:type IX secretion system membrane protein PorP/SprF [Fulvivirga sp. M361]|uniref:PorP/SprF family type IX secretion system membrane protein n=1 Tax=Fulvivirga sp. M361 TaxID=2594266 RepID=UPI00117A63EB|nr:PorP/SprF family type IX secretion system membrane protein [Fulvivirga sp. M361]TRX60185.1 type IX secretion system membrane protein PorP/SprF [Fulvivirga sp. M361]
MKFYALFIVWLLFFAGISSCYSQQYPVISSYMQQPLLISPGAATGYGSETYVQAMHRSQWAGYDNFNETNNRPASQLQLITAALQLKDSAGGLGLVASADKTASLRTIDVRINYAYHIYFSKKGSFGLGIGAGMRSKQMDFNDFIVKHPDDVQLSEGRVTEIQPNLSIGFWINHEQYYLGGSYANFLDQDFEEVNVHDKPVTMITGGYHIVLASDWTLTPGFLWLNEASENVFAFHTMGNYRKLVEVGLSYRHEEALSFITGAWLLNDQSLRLGLAADLITQNSSVKSSASFEVMLGYRFR